MTPRNASRGLARAFPAAVVLGSAFAPATSSAQDRLLNLRTAGVGVIAEEVSFGTGVWQTPLPGQDSVRVRRAAQFSVPLTASVPLGREWLVDATTVYASGSVRYDRVDATGTLRPDVARLAGVSDVRVRLTGQLFDDHLIVTGGFNAPTGRTSLDAGQLSATRVLAAPAVGTGSPPIGSGPSGTVGLLAARTIGAWAVAAGASYEHRGRYAPVAALLAGLTSLDFVPGDVVRLSFAGDGLVAHGRLSATVAADFYRQDRLRGGGVLGASLTPPAGAPASDTATLATAQLGPVVSAGVQYNAPAPAVRDLVFYTALQYRLPYRRDGVRTAGTGAAYLNGGLRTTVPLAPGRDLFGGVDVRYSNGLATGGGLTTTWYTAGALTAGLSQRLGARLTAQPFVRGQVGNVIGRGLDQGHDATLRGGTVGFTLLSRF